MRDHRADAAAAQDVALGARDGERGRLDALRLALERRQLAGADAEQADGETARFAAQSSAGTERRNAPAVETDPPAEEQIRRHATAGAEAGARTSGKRERPEVLQEEIPLLGKEQVEARQVHLLLVDLDLREIGVDRDVDGQVLCHAVLEIAADPVRRVVREAGRDRRIGREARQRVWLQFEHPGAGWHLQAHQRRRRRHLQDAAKRGQRARHLCEVGPLVLPADDAAQVDAPGLLASGLIAERLERDGHLDRPSAVELAGLERSRRCSSRRWAAPRR